MTDTDTTVIQERIGQLCREFKLPTMGALSVARFTESGHGDALPTFLEVLEQEAEDRRHRRINRLRQASRLPRGKTWETFEHHRMPLALRQQLDHLAQGSFVDHGVNVLAFGLPGTGKTHALCALGQHLVEAGHSVLFAPAYRLVQDLLVSIFTDFDHLNREMFTVFDHLGSQIGDHCRTSILRCSDGVPGGFQDGDKRDHPPLAGEGGSRADCLWDWAVP